VLAFSECVTETNLGRIYAMQNAQDVESGEVWRAAQHRRTEDLAKWSSPFLKRRPKSQETDIGWRPLKPRLRLMRGLTVAIIAFAALTSVSAVVHAKKPPHIVLRPIDPMPAVNVT
jgi:hypothetical protein